MKTTLLKSLTLLLLSSTTIACAHTCRDAWYLSASGSLVTRQDVNYVVSHKDLTNTYISDTSFDSGFGLSAAIGKEINQFRVELQYAFAQAKVDSNSRNWKIEDDHFHFVTFNALYDHCLCNNLSIYLGAGIGIAVRSYSIYGEEDLTAFYKKFLTESSGASIALQGMAGISYCINPCIELFLGYSHKFVPKHEKSVTHAGRVHLNTFDLGIRYKL